MEQRQQQFSLWYFIAVLVMLAIQSYLGSAHVANPSYSNVKILAKAGEVSDVALDRPNLKGRERILRVHAKNIVLAPEVDLGQIAARTPGVAGADLANADARARVTETLTRRRPLLELLAKLLLEQEVVDRSALDELLAATGSEEMAESLAPATPSQSTVKEAEQGPEAKQAHA
jgi:hypothetical protein